MSLKQFTLTLKAEEVISQLPSRSKSKFVCDAIIEYSKKKDIMDYYCSQETSKDNASKNKSNKKNPEKSKVENFKEISDDEVNTKW